ncbi:MAG TPA: universal stress protein [Vicinamibacterales bacterium]|nr:universal stress protein [Vicinamibacterales bacterium]
MFTSILCPVDFSPHAERALRYALDLAALTGAHLTIMTAVDPFLDAASSAAGHGEDLMRQTQEEMQALLARIGSARGELSEPPGIAVLTGDAAEEILAQIAECSADLVVMGTQGLGAARQLVFGSTTKRVLRESPVPVLAVPAPGE